MVTQDPPLAWVTGAGGFLSRHVGLALAKCGYEVVGFVEAKVVVLKASAGYGLDEIAATVPVVVTEQTPF